jgi:transcriptional regulator with XRE-family HTH domain
MPVIENHPLRIARVRAGLSAEELGALCGVSRGLINALEQGRVKRPKDAVFIVLARENGVEVQYLRDAYARWLRGTDFTPDVLAVLSPRARAMLELDPAIVRRYGSFVAWRKDFYPSVSGLASLLRVGATSLRRFEAGEVSMPKSLQRALKRVLRLSDDYVEALMVLDASDSDGAAAKYFRRF